MGPSHVVEVRVNRCIEVNQNIEEEEVNVELLLPRYFLFYVNAGEEVLHNVDELKNKEYVSGTK